MHQNNAECYHCEAAPSGKTLSFAPNTIDPIMNQLLKVVFLALFLPLFHHASAQRSFGTIVMGLESGFDVAQFSDGIRARMSPAIQAEFSIGRFSFGAGIGKKFHRAYEFYSFTGETVEREEGGAIVRYYLADLHSFNPNQWIVPVKINFRVHRCDCAYLHLGMVFEKADLRKPDVIKFVGAEYDQPFNQGLVRTQLIKPRTRTYEFGVGFNVFRREFFRLTARPTYVLSENPEIYGQAPDWLPTLRFTFGAQFALWRP